MESTLSPGTSDYSSDYTAIGDEKRFPYYKHLACGAWLLVAGIMIFFFVTAIQDYTPNPPDDELQQAFGSFLQLMSYNNATPEIAFDNAQQMMTNYPDDFQSLLAMAMAYKFMNDEANSTDYLTQARTKGKGDQYNALLPTNDEFNDIYPEQNFTVVNDLIWAVPYFYKWDSAQNFSLSATGYLVRLANSSLVFVNPVPIANLTLFEQVTGKSEPDFMVTQTVHQSYGVLEMVQNQFPDVPLYGVKFQNGYGPAADITFTGYLPDDGGTFLGEFSPNYFQGQMDNECVLLHTPTKTAFLTNLLWLNSVVSDSSWTVPGTDNLQTSFFMRLYFWSYGSWNNVSVPTYPQSEVTDSNAFSQSIKNFEQSTINQILLGLGGTITGNAQSLFETAFAPYV